MEAARRRRGALVAPDTPRSNPYWDDDSYSYDPSGSQAPAVARALERVQLLRRVLDRETICVY